jgi:hypothetical protein
MRPVRRDLAPPAHGARYRLDFVECLGVLADDGRAPTPTRSVEHCDDLQAFADLRISADIAMEFGLSWMYDNTSASEDFVGGGTPSPRKMIWFQ